MSVVAALFNRDGSPIDEHAVAQMVQATAHCAVDGLQVWCENHIALAHQHFWITPEEVDERQPLIDRMSGCVLVFDGRIDNRAELWRQLAPDDRWATSSDATLVLQAYLHWGRDVAAHLLGDFAFVLWDGRRQQLLLARDPLGVRQICYWVDERHCVIGTSVANVLAHPALTRRVNERRMAEYVVREWAGSRETWFDNVFWCEPGACVLVTSLTVHHWHFWSVDPDAKVRFRDERDYAEQFRTLLDDAVQSRMRSIGQTGILLSGGLDSTSVAALAAPALAASATRAGNLTAFSFVYDRFTDCDERQYIEPVVRQYGLDWQQIPVDDCGPVADSSRYVTAPDFVITNPAELGLLQGWEAAQAAGCRVLLNGEFGDHLLYAQRFWAVDMMADRQYGALWSTLGQLGEFDGYGLRAAADSVARNLLPRRVRRLYRSVRPRDEMAQWQQKGLAPEFIARSGLNEHLRENRRHVEARGMPRRIADHIGVMRLPDQMATAAIYANELCRYHMTYATPFRDRRLVEYVLALPGYVLGLPVPGQTKRLLRVALGDRLPEFVRRRQDKTVPVSMVYQGFCREWARMSTLLRQSLLVEWKVLNPAWLAPLIQAKGTDLDFYTLRHLWDLRCLEVWLQTYA